MKSFSNIHTYKCLRPLVVREVRIYKGSFEEMQNHESTYEKEEGPRENYQSVVVVKRDESTTFSGSESTRETRYLLEKTLSPYTLHCPRGKCCSRSFVPRPKRVKKTDPISDNRPRDLRLLL